MTTVSTFIDSARYDIRDYNTGLEFDDDELIEYINRMFKVLDSTLTSMNSSFVSGYSALVVPISTLRYNVRTNLNSGKWDSIREIWIGKNRLEKISVDLMWYKQRFNSSQQTTTFPLVVGNTYEILTRTTLDFVTCGATANTVGTVFVCTVTGTLGTGDTVMSWSTGEPNFWSQEGPNIIFEMPTNAIYTFNFHFNKTTGVLISTSDMPYNDMFNETFRELFIMHARAKKEGQVGPTEQTYSAMFKKVAFEYIIRADFKPKYYHLGF